MPTRALKAKLTEVQKSLPKDVRVEVLYDRTELVVLITPRALQSDDQLRAVSDEMRRRFSNSLGGIANWSEISGEQSEVPAQGEPGSR